MKFQIDVGHPLVDDELPEVPPGGRAGARQCQAVRQLLGHPWRRRKGANLTEKSIKFFFEI